MHILKRLAALDCSIELEKREPRRCDRPFWPASTLNSFAALELLKLAGKVGDRPINSFRRRTPYTLFSTRLLPVFILIRSRIPRTSTDDK